MKLRTYLIAAFVTAATVMALAPSASATNYNQCIPTNLACVNQSDGAGWDCSEGYLAWYGPKYARDGVFIAGPGGVTADAWAGEACARFFKWSTYSYGATAGAAAGTDASARVSWFHYWTKAAPNCNYGSYSEEGDSLSAVASVAGSTYGAQWVGGQRTACQGPFGSFCHTYLRTGGIADQDLGCPIGKPPGPPSPGQVPYGNILP